MKQKKQHNLPKSLIDFDLKDQKTIKLAQKLVQIPSLTPIDAKDLPAARQSLDLIESLSKNLGAETYRLPFSGGHKKWDYEVDNLYVEFTIGSPDTEICYIGHTDVVPTGDEKKWTSPAFSGEINNGYLHGRGTTDMKGSVAAYLSAIDELLSSTSENDPLNNIRIGILLTTDEEWAAVNGTQQILKWLKQKGRNPDAFIVGEPSSHDTVASHIKLGRRGSLCGTFNIKGTQGHAAYTELFENPNRALALAVAILNDQTWSDGNAYFPNTNFETIAIESGNFKASAVVPAEAKLLWNIRYTPTQTPEGLQKWISERLQNPPQWAKHHKDYKSLKNIEVIANIDTASLPYYSQPKKLAKAVSDAIQSVAGKLPIMDGSGGTTDGRFVQKFFPKSEIIELGLPERGGISCHHKMQPLDYLKKGGMHQIDERASLSDIISLKHIFKQSILNYQNSTLPQTQKNAKNDNRRKPKFK